MQWLTKGEAVDVHRDLGHVLGKSWTKAGHTFEEYESADKPRQTCLVRIVGGFTDGCVVRYKAADVRRSQVKS